MRGAPLFHLSRSSYVSLQPLSGLHARFWVSCSTNVRCVVRQGFLRVVRQGFLRARAVRHPMERG